MDDFVTLGVGIVTGSVTVLVAWCLVSFARRKSSRLRNEKSERIMISIEELWTEVDGIIASYRTGRITADAFRVSLSEKILVINRIYKPSLHRLDIFFVKYTEKLIEEYNRMVESAASGVSRQGTDSGLISFPAEAKPPYDDRHYEEEATVVSTGTSLTKQQDAGPNIEQQVFNKVADLPAEEEEIISAMAEASKAGDELSIETLLEMETGTGTVEVIEPKPVSDEKKETAEPAVVRSEIPKEAESPEIEEKSLAEKKEQEGTTSASASEYSEETMVAEPEPQFSFTEKASSVIPASPTDVEIVEPEAPSEAESSEDEETMAEAAVPLPVKKPAVPQVALPPSLRTPFVLPQQPAPVVAGESEEVAQPATIYDIEAETIIADRNDLLGTSKVTEPQVEKSNLGITGDDVSDMLDQFFGGSKH
jgi:hypothetical protein